MSNPKPPTPRVGKALSSILSGTRIVGDAPAELHPNASPASTPASERPRIVSPAITTEVVDVGDKERASAAALPTADSTLHADASTAPVRHLTIESRQPAQIPSLAEGKGSARKRETFLIDAELADEMRDAIVHLQGPPRFLNLATFGEEAIRAYLHMLKAEHTGGANFPRRPHAVRQGRPLR